MPLEIHPGPPPRHRLAAAHERPKLLKWPENSPSITARCGRVYSAQPARSRRPAGDRHPETHRFNNARPPMPTLSSAGRRQRRYSAPHPGNESTCRLWRNRGSIRAERSLSRAGSRRSAWGRACSCCASYAPTAETPTIPPLVEQVQAELSGEGVDRPDAAARPAARAPRGAGHQGARPQEEAAECAG